MAEKLYIPDEKVVEGANVTSFLASLNQQHGLALTGVGDLHRWSCERVEDFWRVFFNTYKLGRTIPDTESILEIPDTGEETGVKNAIMFARFFPNEHLNAAEILLRGVDDNEVVLVFRGEQGTRRELTGSVLKSKVAAVAAFLRNKGIGIGDRVVALMPNCPETIIAFLATASIGAIWSSCSPDFGVKAACDRFGQVAPKLFFCVEGYHYGGKNHDCRAKVRKILEELPTVQQVVVTEFLEKTPSLDLFVGLQKTFSYMSQIDETKQALTFADLPFDHPLLIAFSSGTTGVPKCIVHRAGGVTVNLQKEHILHCDIKKGDTVTYFTTCGWMMWNWLVGCLGVGAKLVLYDGNPLPKNNPGTLLQMAAEEKISLFGTSARYLHTLMQMKYDAKVHNLRHLRTVTATGSPLSSEGFRYVYSHIKEDVHLASISGGTDIMGCFLLGMPTFAVREGQLQVPGFGMDVVVYDKGRPCENSKGELVCRTPFPNQPLGFWGDDDGSRYYAAYYSTYPDVWYHGDFMTHIAGEGYVIHGRSDTTLNPGGVRIGSAEITRIVDMVDGIVESVAVGKEHENDVVIIVFVILQEGHVLSEDKKLEIVKCLKEQASPRHVPTAIGAVVDIPRTRSGKTSETAISDIIHGQGVANVESLANPESLAHFADHPCLKKI